MEEFFYSFNKHSRVDTVLRARVHKYVPLAAPVGRTVNSDVYGSDELCWEFDEGFLSAIADETSVIELLPRLVLVETNLTDAIKGVRIRRRNRRRGLPELRPRNHGHSLRGDVALVDVDVDGL